MAPVSQLPLLILISFDGFRHDYISPDNSPNLYELSQGGTLGHMESMCITKTFPNHFSMVTGLYEDEHEIINNKMIDPRLNGIFKPGVWLPKWWDPKKTTIPIWRANELFGSRNDSQPRFSGSMMYPGGAVPFHGSLPTYLRDYDNVRNWTLNIDTVINWLIDSNQPANFVAMYFDEPDTTAHWNGPWGKVTLNAVRQIDDAVGYLIRRLRDEHLLNKTNLIFVSDHGMAEVNNVIFLSDFIDTSSFDLIGNSPDWSVFIKADKRHLKKKIFSQLLSLSRENHFKIYERSKIPPEFHYSKTPRIGDFFIFVDEKYDLFMDRSSSPRKIPDVWGNHGWLPSNEDMRPLFMAHGPSFKRNYYHSEPFPNIDLFPLMIHLLDLPAEKLHNNGSLKHIIDIIDSQEIDGISRNDPSHLLLSSSAFSAREVTGNVLAISLALALLTNLFLWSIK